MRPLSRTAIEAFANDLRETSGRIQRRELLCAAAGLKPVRLMAQVDDAVALLELVGRHGLGIVEGRAPAWIRLDAGKGGWSSGSAAEGEGEEHRFLYISDTEAGALELRDAEESGNAELFGRALLVPACCRAMFLEHAERAQSLQNDFFCHSFPDAVQEIPWELNLVAQYFDAALVSHYPCNAACADSLRLARIAGRIVAALLPEDARAMRTLMQRTGVYSEYDGICLVDFEPTVAGEFERQSDANSFSSRGRLFQALRDSHWFRIRGTELESRTRRDSCVHRFDGLRVLSPTGVDRGPLMQGVLRE